MICCGDVLSPLLGMFAGGSDYDYGVNTCSLELKIWTCMDKQDDIGVLEELVGPELGSGSHLGLAGCGELLAWLWLNGLGQCLSQAGSITRLGSAMGAYPEPVLHRPC